jgi:hypothetical protein
VVGGAVTTGAGVVAAVTGAAVTAGCTGCARAAVVAGAAVTGARVTGAAVREVTDATWATPVTATGGTVVDGTGLGPPEVGGGAPAAGALVGAATLGEAVVTAAMGLWCRASAATTANIVLTLTAAAMIRPLAALCRRRRGTADVEEVEVGLERGTMALHAAVVSVAVPGDVWPSHAAEDERGPGLAGGAPRAVAGAEFARVEVAAAVSASDCPAAAGPGDCVLADPPAGRAPGDERARRAASAANRAARSSSVIARCFPIGK